ncbi:C3a anaphylatoxin chemotactic receptor-like [Astyanax mexicanus]|uniref:C3a anaphylatoxin chemotactic receptor-like n=1 Tax=Astyanax mexicanus TaxID=7994 RepID=A0A8T2KS29_ASTMX|nr:C3a anaphylatoxin chemotactic receptor-like [Astyanax mexicanus]KAG9261429.1 C3a anaphylatoxin chemotactic receptor-like [Astyanax mexicanus]
MNSTELTADPVCRGALCIFYAVANVIIFILGVGGNGLVIWITGFKVKKSVVNTWYLSLALSDFLFCCTLPFSVIHVIMKDWIFGLFMCKLMFFAVYFNWFSSIFVLAIVSVDRCVLVKFPVWAQNKRTVRKASVIVLLVWIISAAYCLPTAYSLEVLNDEYNQTKNCFYSYTMQEEEIVDVIFDFIFGFVIPFLIIVICYAIIIRKLKTNQMAKSKKPFKIMTALIVTFLICWLPYHTFTLMDLNYEKYKRFIDTGSTIAVIFANANSCLNPFLYTFTGKDFKKQCYTLRSKIENAFEEDEESKSKGRGTAFITPGEGKLLTTGCSLESV